MIVCKHLAMCVLSAVFAKGQTVTGPYRFLAKYSGYVWLETSASVVTKSAFEEPQIICINHTIGFSTSLLQFFAFSSLCRYDVRHVTKFEFRFDVRILATSVVFDIRQIVEAFLSNRNSQKIFNLSLRTATGEHVWHVHSWFSAARDILICYNLQMRRLDQ